jgi:hypothetical protein
MPMAVRILLAEEQLFYIFKVILLVLKNVSLWVSPSETWGYDNHVTTLAAAETRPRLIFSFARLKDNFCVLRYSGGILTVDKNCNKNTQCEASQQEV